MNPEYSFKLNLILMMLAENEKNNDSTFIKINATMLKVVEYVLPDFLLKDPYINKHPYNIDALVLNVGSKATPFFAPLIKEGNEFLKLGTSFNRTHYDLLVPVITVIDVAGLHSTSFIQFRDAFDTEEAVKCFNENKDKSKTSPSNNTHLKLVK